MERLAAYHDRLDGAKNLLVLNGRPGFAGDSDVFVIFLPDGGIKIIGNSDVRAWKQIGDLSLSPGTYSFSGLSGVEEKTVALVLEYRDIEANKSIRLTKDVGTIEETSFTINEEKEIRAYVSIYPGANGSYIAYPVIYREN